MTIETKFNVRDKVYFMYSAIVQEGYIDEITANVNIRGITICKYFINGLLYHEFELFASKEELLK
jgi:hypothetical protein